MGEMASLWGYAEHHDMDQLGQKLLFTTLELEKFKTEAMEEMQKNKEYVDQLIHLLKCAIQERDEARNQLGNLINKTISLSNSENFLSLPHFQPGKANSSVTESNSQSETHNYHSHDAVSSPEFSNINFVANQQPLLVQDSAVANGFNSVNLIDQGSLIIENLAKGRVLPKKGMFLQAVVEAGPLLQTLLLAGPLPRWRNPPRLQPFQIPPVTIKGGGVGEVSGGKTAASVGQLGMSAHSYGNFGNGLLMSSAVSSSNGCFRLEKGQRFC